MAETPQGTTPAPEPLIAVGDRQEPLSLVVKGFQALSATEKRAMDASKRAEQLEAQLKEAGPHAARWQQLQAMVASNPQAALEEMQRLVAVATGQPLGSQTNSGAADQMKLDSRVQHLEATLNEIRQQQLGRTLNEQVNAAVSAYPLFTNSEEARRHVQKVAMAELSADPKADVREIVSGVHTDLQKLSQASVAQTVAQRQAVAATTAAPPQASGATPGLTNPEPALNRNSIKDGSLQARLLNRWNQMRAGPNATTG